MSEIQNPEIVADMDGFEYAPDAEEARTCHCGAPAQGAPSDYPDVCSQWPLCERRITRDEARRNLYELEDRHFAEGPCTPTRCGHADQITRDGQ